MSDQNDLKEKIAQAKQRLPMPILMERLGLAKHAKKSARCPIPGHEDKHPSFSIYRGDDGFWHYKCHSRCGDGDEIMFLRNLKGISLGEAISVYLDMAGFPPRRSSESREYPPSLDRCISASPESLDICVSVSEGQEVTPEQDKVLRGLAARNACRARDTASRRRFKLVRDIKAIEKGLGGRLDVAYLKIAFNEWRRLSLPFLDPAEDYWLLFLAELEKVRMPTGEGPLDKALEKVSKLTLDALPELPGYPDAPEDCRRVAALHRELSPPGGGVYFLSYRDAAKVCKGLTQQKAHIITGALVRLGVIQMVSKGEARPNGGKAAEFRYLLPVSPPTEGIEL